MRWIWITPLLVTGCIKGPSMPDELPRQGAVEILVERDGQKVVDTVYEAIDDFTLVDQDSQVLTPDMLEGKVVLVDFFFTSCPTICPKMSKQMLRVYKEFEDDDRVVLISHSIDTRNDSVPRLKDYAQKLGVDRSDRWHFVTASREEIYSLAKQYMVSAQEDEKAPGGYLHSGHFVLVDGDHYLRSYCDGIVEEEVDQMMMNMRFLLKEMEGESRN